MIDKYQALYGFSSADGLCVLDRSRGYGATSLGTGMSSNAVYFDTEELINSAKKKIELQQITWYTEEIAL